MENPRLGVTSVKVLFQLGIELGYVSRYFGQIEICKVIQCKIIWGCYISNENLYLAFQELFFMVMFRNENLVYAQQKVVLENMFLKKTSTGVNL